MLQAVRRSLRLSQLAGASIQHASAAYSRPAAGQRIIFAAAPATAEHTAAAPLPVARTAAPWGLRFLSSQAAAKEDDVSKRPNVRGPVSWLSFGILLMTGAGVYTYFESEKKRRLAQLSGKAESAGKAAIGGPFTMVDHNGRAFTEKDLLGKYTMVYFGFTHCPDICPDELEKVVASVDTVEKATGVQLTPIFASIDPERDSVAQVKKYVKEFHPRLVGLTGTPEQCKAMARAYRVYYSKAGDGNDYLVDHSIITYLMDPKGEFVAFFGKNYTASTLADKVAELVRPAAEANIRSIAPARA